MNRKQFIESQGATCRNWRWSWSYINEKDKVIIFGAWDIHTNENKSLILSEDWQAGQKGRKKPAYRESREHIRLIEEERYQLKTFPIVYSNANKDEYGIGPAKIKDFTRELTIKTLERSGGGWYAIEDEISRLLPEEVENQEKYIEGASKNVFVNAYERNSDARRKCIEHHGYKCAICSFDFEEYYGSIGEKYIHVHHVVPLAEIKKEYIIDPIKDLVPVCPNCHAMLHRRMSVLTIERLKEQIAGKKKRS